MTRQRFTEYSYRAVAGSFLSAALLQGLAGCGGSTQPSAAPESPAEAAPAPQDDAAAQHRDDAFPAEGATAEEETDAARGAPAPSAVAPAKQRAEAADSEMVVEDDALLRLAEQLSGALAAADCSGAARYRDAICDISEKICDVAAGLPNSHQGRDRCDDGRQRCESAKRRVSERCD